MASLKLPFWLRLVLLVGIVLVITGAGLMGYRYYSRPTTLKVAAGSADGEATKAMSAIASRFVATDAPVRLTVIDTGSMLEAAKAFAAGKVDLAVIRGDDIGNLPKAQTVVIVAHGVAMIIAPPGSSITSIDQLKRRTVGVLGGEGNRRIVEVLKKEYNLVLANTIFKDIAPADARRALQSKEVDAILVVLPLTEKYLSLVKGLFPQNVKAGPVLIPIESAGAIADNARAYESFDIPKGTLRGAPPNPEDDLTTLRVGLYLVAQSKLGVDLITSLTQSIMNARRDLLGELPILTQITAPSTDPDAFLPMHPGAAAFYNGTQQSFMDKYGNAIYLAPMILGAIASVLAAGWKFLGIGQPEIQEGVLDSLYSLARRIRQVGSEAELSDIEEEVDTILKTELKKTAAGDESAIDIGTLNLAAQRLENLIHYRRAALIIPSPSTSTL